MLEFHDQSEIPIARYCGHDFMKGRQHFVETSNTVKSNSSYEHTRLSVNWNCNFCRCTYYMHQCLKIPKDPDPVCTYLKAFRIYLELEAHGYDLQADFYTHASVQTLDNQLVNTRSGLHSACWWAWVDKAWSDSSSFLQNITFSS